MIDPITLEFIQGETVDPVISLFESDGVTPLDITGDTFEAQIRDLDDLAAAQPVASFTCTPDVPNSKVALEIAHGMSVDIPATVQFNSRGVESNTPLKRYIYDVFRLTSGGKRKAAARGPVKVYPTATRS